MRISAEEKRIYNELVYMVGQQLQKHDLSLPKAYIVRTINSDFAILSFTSIKRRYLVKLCPSYWTRRKIQMTVPESKLVEDCYGCVFLMGKGVPPSELRPYDYDLCLVPTHVIQSEIRNHLKSVESACFFKFLLTFYPSRILTWGTLI
jgi:hypothetical protein